MVPLETLSHSNENDMVQGITDVLPSPEQEAAITVLKRLDEDQGHGLA